jgi:hypothetical protein
MFARTTKHGKEAAVVAVIAAALAFASAGPASAAASCPTDKGAKTQVAALVAQLHDVVPSHNARAATRVALVHSLHALRDTSTPTKADRVNFGKQISALAKTLHTAPGLVERKAIIASIHALQAQKAHGPLTAHQRTQITADDAALEKVIVAKADTRAQQKAITAQFRLIHKTFTCTA